MTRLIDSHAHLDFDKFDEDRPDVLARAAAAGVDTILTIGTDLASSRRALALASKAYEGVRIFASAGVHPHQADAFDDAHWLDLTALFIHPRVKAVGETGLDYYYDFSDRGRQQVLFKRHLELCGEVGRPIVVHIRDAFEDTWRLVEAVGLPAGGVVHCFTGGPAECEKALSLGFHISISGIATFKNAHELRAAVALIPDDRLLVETDSPSWRRCPTAASATSRRLWPRWPARWPCCGASLSSTSPASLARTPSGSSACETVVKSRC
jgi:TatD DNase family protein